MSKILIGVSYLFLAKEVELSVHLWGFVMTTLYYPTAAKMILRAILPLSITSNHLTMPLGIDLRQI